VQKAADGTYRTGKSLIVLDVEKGGEAGQTTIIDDLLQVVERPSLADVGYCPDSFALDFNISVA
jgi:hypothetical protein